MPTSIELTPEMMREIIMDHYQNPRHKGKPSDPKKYLSLHASSTNCIDDFEVYLDFEDGKVKDALWDGVACTISTASTDILCDRILGDDAKQGHYLIEQYLAMIEEKPYDASVLDEAIVFMNTGKQAARIHCATMGWTAMKELLEKEETH
jgi:nitrogen fixation NifU-like protein